LIDWTFSVLAGSSEPIFRWAARVLVNSIEACRHGRKVTIGIPLWSVSVCCPTVSFPLIRAVPILAGGRTTKPCRYILEGTEIQTHCYIQKIWLLVRLEKCFHYERLVTYLSHEIDWSCFTRG
jgi:hypothetical protein